MAFSIINIVHMTILTGQTSVIISLVFWAGLFHALNVGIVGTNWLVNLGTILHKSFLQGALVNLGLTFTKLNQKGGLNNHKE